MVAVEIVYFLAGLELPASQQIFDVMIFRTGRCALCVVHGCQGARAAVRGLRMRLTA